MLNVKKIIRATLNESLWNIFRGPRAPMLQKIKEDIASPKIIFFIILTHIKLNFFSKMHLELQLTMNRLKHHDKSHWCVAL